jgi:hypothetical protein
VKKGVEMASSLLNTALAYHDTLAEYIESLSWAEKRNQNEAVILAEAADSLLSSKKVTVSDWGMTVILTRLAGLIFVNDGHTWKVVSKLQVGGKKQLKMPDSVAKDVLKELIFDKKFQELTTSKQSSKAKPKKDSTNTDWRVDDTLDETQDDIFGAHDNERRSSDSRSRGGRGGRGRGSQSQRRFSQPASSKPAATFAGSSSSSSSASAASTTNTQSRTAQSSGSAGAL